MMYAVNLALVLFLVFANAFFVVSEFAIVKIRRTKLEELAHAGNKQAKIAIKITDRLNTYLSAIQLGIALASLAGALVCGLFQRKHHFAAFGQLRRSFRLYHSAARCSGRTGSEITGNSAHGKICSVNCPAAVSVQPDFCAVHLGV